MRNKIADAREQLGWSQGRLVSELERRGQQAGVAVMVRNSLKTAVSRWENGHVLPDRHYRRLLHDILGLTDTDPGCDTITEAGNQAVQIGADLQAQIAASSRVDAGMVKILQSQTDNIRRLDRRLGAPVLLDQMQAHIATLTQLLRHSVLESARRPIPAALGDAAALAGWQAIDVGALAQAWDYFETADAAGRIAGQPELSAHARGEQAYALLEVDRPSAALALVRDARQEAGNRIPARLRSWLWSAEAEVAAAAGSDSECRHALDQAAAVLPAEPVDDPELPYLSLDEHHLARWRGSTLARLGDHEAVA